MTTPGWIRVLSPRTYARDLAIAAAAREAAANRALVSELRGHVKDAKASVTNAGTGIESLGAGTASEATQATTIEHLRAALTHLDKAGAVKLADEGRAAGLAQAREGIEQLMAGLEGVTTTQSVGSGLYADTTSVLRNIEVMRSGYEHPSGMAHLLNARTHAVDLLSGTATEQSLSRMRIDLEKAHSEYRGYLNAKNLSSATMGALNDSADLRPAAQAKMLKADVTSLEGSLRSTLSALE